MNRALLRRLAGASSRSVPFTLDGRACTGREGDTVLTAVLAEQARVCPADADGRPRAGFCAMGACQDCWLFTADGRQLRACTTPLTAGLVLITTGGR